MLPVQQQQQSMTHRGRGGVGGGSAAVVPPCTAVTLGNEPCGVSTIVAVSADRGPGPVCRCDQVN